ncbi:MAG: Gmad2 immunoglobulin-like domain-containing protein [Anaerolineaceae bacterium]
MKTALRFGSFFLLVLVAACVPSVQNTIEITTPSETLIVEATVNSQFAEGLTEQELKSMSYISPNSGILVQLVEGVYADESMTLTLLPQVAIGDLNGDAIDDAAVLLAENEGGTGTFVSLVVIASRDGTFDQVGTTIIDDRPVIESLTIQEGTIRLNALVHSLNDAMVSPTEKVSFTYRLLENNLTMMRRTSTLQGGMERLIIIENPQNGSEVSGTFRIAGSMPVAPFENNLSLTILDQAGAEFYRGGFMVISEDMGEPAVFDNEITLPAIPSGTWVKLELTDISMADGSVISMESVLVKIK